MTILMKNKILSSKYLPYYKIIFFLVVSRIILTFVGLTSRYFLHPEDSIINNLISVWAQWDAGWYNHILTYGYVADHSYNPYFGNQANYAFFPLYPLLIKVVSYLFNVHNYYIAGILISNLCLIISCIYLYKISLFYYDKKQSFDIIMWFIIFPASFLFSCVLTEGLYIALVLICFYYAKKDKWFLVGLAGFFLALTRNIGVFIILPLLLQYLVNVKFKLYEIKLNVLYLLFIPAGFVAWGIYLYNITGDFLMFKNVQNTWGRISSDPISVLYHSIISGNLDEIVLGCFSIILIFFLIINIKRIPLPYLLFAAYSVLIPLSTSVTSMIRYSIVIFPIYFLLIHFIKNEYIKTLVLYCSLIVQGLFFVFWSSGYPLIF